MTCTAAGPPRRLDVAAEGDPDPGPGKNNKAPRSKKEGGLKGSTGFSAEVNFIRNRSSFLYFELIGIARNFRSRARGKKNNNDSEQPNPNRDPKPMCFNYNT